MRPTTRLAAFAATTAVACAAASADASAISLGSPGAKVSSVASIPANSPLVFGAGLDSYAKKIFVSCDSRRAGAGLNLSGGVTSAGWAALRLDSAQCETYNPNAGATIGATRTPIKTTLGGFLRLTPTALKPDASNDNKNGILSIVSAPLVFTIGGCTLSVATGTTMPGPPDQSTSAGRLYDGSFRFDGTTRATYTGSAGCPAEHRGTHSDLGITAWYQTLVGTKLTP